MQTRSWDDKTSGEKKYRTEIVADRVQFGPRSSGTGTGAASQGAPAGKADKGTEAKGAVKDEVIEYPEEEINAEDIPF